MSEMLLARYIKCGHETCHKQC